MNKIIGWVLGCVILINYCADAQYPPTIINFTSSNLPIIIIDTHGQQIVDTPEIFATMKIIDNGTGNNQVTDAPNIYNGLINIEYRGNSSLYHDKKSFGLETLKSTDSTEREVGLFGFPPESDWILIANFFDPTHVKNAFMQDLWRQTGRYGPRVKFCEVVINDKYIGLYLFIEKIKRDKNRVNISKLEPQDIGGEALTGGYIIKKDNLSGTISPNIWYSNYHGNDSKPFMVEYPKEADLQPQQFNYIRTFFRDFEDALSSSNFRDSTNGYRKYIDVDSFIDFFILEEFCLNIDAFSGSIFYNKDKNKKISAGPVWDFDEAFNHQPDCNGTPNYQGWIHVGNSCYMPNRMFWWERFTRDCYFSKKMRLRFLSLRQNVLSQNNLNTMLNNYGTLLSAAAARNIAAWGNLPQHSSSMASLTNWVNNRVLWMDANIHTIDRASVNIWSNQYLVNYNNTITLSASSCDNGNVRWYWQTSKASGEYNAQNWNPKIMSNTTFAAKCVYNDGCESFASQPIIISLNPANNGCGSSLNLNGTVNQTPMPFTKYQASQSINSQQSISSDNTAFYKANNYIVLQPGFQTQPNAKFISEIGGCDNN